MSLIAILILLASMSGCSVGLIAIDEQLNKPEESSTVSQHETPEELRTAPMLAKRVAAYP